MSEPASQSEIQIRIGAPDDATAIAAFDCFGGDRPAALQEQRCLVATIDEQITGFVVYKRKSLIGRDFIEFLVVDEPFRRRGIAIALLRAVEREVGPGRLFISTEANNTRMLALLDKDGWTPSGQIDNLNDSGHVERFFCRDVASDPA